VWTNLYKPQATRILTGIPNQNLVFLFSIMGFNFNVKCCTNHMFNPMTIIILCHKKCEYHLINVALTQLPSSYLHKSS
jgi:hypothetical protein